MESSIYNAKELFIENNKNSKNLIDQNIHPEIDFHIHSTNSDGIFNISEIADMAKKSNLSHIIITDHNTILNGYNELLDYKSKNKESKLKINIGSEVACKFKDIYTNKYIPIEVLCFNINPYILQKYLDKYCFFSEGSQEKDMEYLLDVCSTLNLRYSEDLKAKKGFYATETLCRDLIKYPENKKFFDETYPEVFTSPKLFFKKFCANPKSSFYIDKTEGLPTVEELCLYVKENDGICILAHPCLYIYKEKEEILSFLEKINLSCKIDGIEVFHANHTKIRKEFLLQFANKNNLIYTGGSDFHTGPRFFSWIWKNKISIRT